jgi:hypothetical protein
MELRLRPGGPERFGSAELPCPDGLSEVYVDIDEARAEIRRRWANVGLRRALTPHVEQIEGQRFGSPVAWKGTHVATPDHSFFAFVTHANSIGLPFVVGEYLDDKFYPQNRDKYHLARLFFHHGTGRKGGVRLVPRTIVEMTQSQGRQLRAITTLWGESLPSAHHRMLRAAHERQTALVDLSGYFSANGGDPREYYVRYLSIFVCHAVLFENFLPSEAFTQDVFLPAFREVVARYGVRPLIVPLAPRDWEDDIYWWCHPGYLSAFLEPTAGEGDGSRRKS